MAALLEYLAAILGNIDLVFIWQSISLSYPQNSIVATSSSLRKVAVWQCGIPMQ